MCSLYDDNTIQTFLEHTPDGLPVYTEHTFQRFHLIVPKYLTHRYDCAGRSLQDYSEKDQIRRKFPLKCEDKY